MTINYKLSKKVFVLLCILWVINKSYMKFGKLIKNNNLLKSIFIFSLFYIFSIFWSDNVNMAFKMIEIYLVYFLLPIIVLSTSIKKDTVNYCLGSFMLAMIINELISYGIYFGLIDNIFGFSVHGNKHNPVPFQTSHISYSVYISFTVFLILYGLYKNKIVKTKFIAILFLLTMLSNLFLSTGRTGQLVLILTSAFLILRYFFRKKVIMLISTLLLVCILVVAYSNSSTFNQRVNIGKQDIVNVINNRDYESSFGVRLAFFTIFPKLFLDNNILFGVGIGDTKDLVNKRAIKVFGDKSVMSQQRGRLHNTFLEVLFSLGIFGMILFFNILYFLLKNSNNDYENNYLKYILFLTIIISGISASLFDFRDTMLLVSLFLSIIIVRDSSINTIQ